MNTHNNKKTGSNPSSGAISNPLVPDERPGRTRPGFTEPLDIYAGPEWEPTEVREMTRQQREDAIFENHMMDREGQDSAYDNGYTDTRKPAPKSGWPLGTPYEDLI